MTASGLGGWLSGWQALEGLQGMYLAFFLRIGVAAVCGGAIGFERTKRNKEAGVRTHCIIALASALLMILSKYAFADVLAGGVGNVDYGRMAAQVVSGVSFLGTGVIFVKNSAVKGLTTAAGIWATAAVGLSLGAGLYPLGLFSTLVVVLLQLVFHSVSVGNDAYTARQIEVVMEDEPGLREELFDWFILCGTRIEDYEIEKLGEGLIAFRISARMSTTIHFLEALDFMDLHPQVRKFRL